MIACYFIFNSKSLNHIMTRHLCTQICIHIILLLVLAYTLYIPRNNGNGSLYCTSISVLTKQAQTTHAIPFALEHSFSHIPLLLRLTEPE